MKRVSALALTIAAGALPIEAKAADCAPQFIDRSLSANISPTSIGSEQLEFERVPVRLRNDGEGRQCSATLRVARVSTSPISQYPFYLQFGGRKIDLLPFEDAPGGASSNLLVPQLPASREGRNLPLDLVLPVGWGLASGSTSEELELQILGPDGSISDRIPLRVNVTIPTSIEMRIVGATGDRAIAGVDMGVLNPDAINRSSLFGLRVWSTAPYMISFLSENDGQLVQSERRGAIEYDLQMEGRSVGVSGGIAAQVPNPTDALGDLHRLRVEIQPFVARAGDYSDRVVVTVTAT